MNENRVLVDGVPCEVVSLTMDRPIQQLNGYGVVKKSHTCECGCVFEWDGKVHTNIEAVMETDYDYDLGESYDWYRDVCVKCQRGVSLPVEMQTYYVTGTPSTTLVVLYFGTAETVEITSARLPSISGKYRAFNRRGGQATFLKLD